MSDAYADSHPVPSGAGQAPVALVDLLDRVLAGGVVVAGEITLCVADVELVHVSARLLLSSVGTLAESLRTTPPPQIPGDTA
jgi:hypothetical protein